MIQFNTKMGDYFGTIDNVSKTKPRYQVRFLIFNVFFWGNDPLVHYVF